MDKIIQSVTKRKGVKGGDPTTDDALDNMFDASVIEDIIVENDSVPTSAFETRQKAKTLSSRPLRRDCHSDSLAIAMT